MSERVESGGKGKVAYESRARKRKPNFSMNEISVITENVKNHLAVIQAKLTKNITNQKKNEVWQKITDAVNAVGTAGQTVAEVKDKWKICTAPQRKNFQLLEEKQRKLEVDQRQCPEARPVRKLLKFSRTHPLSAA